MERCARCGLPILFERFNGRMSPINPNGSPHGDLCDITVAEKATGKSINVSPKFKSDFEIVAKHYDLAGLGELGAAKAAVRRDYEAAKVSYDAMAREIRGEAR